MMSLDVARAQLRKLEREAFNATTDIVEATACLERATRIQEAIARELGELRREVSAPIDTKKTFSVSTGRG